MDPGSLVSHRNQLPGASRYELLVKIATGGTATVYVGRIIAAEGFQRLVAVKLLLYQEQEGAIGLPLVDVPGGELGDPAAEEGADAPR